MTLLSRQAAAAEWQLVSPLPEPRWFHAAGIGRDGRLYAYGGYVRPSATREYGLGDYSLAIFDPEKNAWSRGPTVPPVRLPARGRKIVGRIGPDGKVKREVVATERMGTDYVSHELSIGRADPLGRPCWYGVTYWLPFDPEKGAWSSAQSVFAPRDSHDEGIAGSQRERRIAWFRYTPTVATSRQGLVYVTGGSARPYRDRSARPRVHEAAEVWDARTNSWREIAPMKQARELHAAAVDGRGRLFVFGGSGAEPSVTNEDGEADEAFRRRADANRILANASLASVEMYDPATNTWTDRAPIPTPRQALGADLGADGRIYVVGGAPSYSHPRPMAVVEIYDPETDTWETGPSMNYARRGHAVVATPDGKLYAIGGVVGKRQRTLREQLAGDFVDPALGATVEVLDTRPAR